MPDYIPSTEADLVIWLADHAAGVSTHGATVGLTAGEITQAATDATMGNMVVVARSLYASKTQEVTEYKNILLYSAINTPVPSLPSAPSIGPVPMGALAAIVARARQRAERIKAHPAYTTAIGEDCRIIAPGPPPSGGTVQPTLTAKAETAFQVRLTFTMSGHDVLEIYAMRGAEADFTMLALDTSSPYIDGRPPLVAGTPEVRQYKARYRDGDLPVGDWSDIISITAQP